MSDQLRQQEIDALLREREGYERKLSGADDSDTKAAMKDQVLAVNEQLNRLGYKLDAAARATEKKGTVKTVSKKAPAKKPAKKR